ncbi:glycosyltransferase family 2 protein [Jiella pelagia]|uniref:Glycosyltransferase family 2 protein n=1 Tax=Jiella pelagia TaxID=2986949 RepID=A0ABY7CAF8_9HYPH|nr:glycosyltransferase family 2 protein [Jiella pelagia]WAP70775.1 glycosyltransferase family 2 protein [Jiella pelagia]
MNITVDPAKLSTAKPGANADASTDVVLSICVPTYNRANFLRHLFPHIREVAKAFDFSYEIVVSDNCSPDETPEIVQGFIAEGLPIRYFRQEENKRLSNLFSAFRHARGEFLVYLADDDLIIPEALADNIRFMRDNPEIRALYTPWEIYDALAGKAHGQFFRLPKPVQVFSPGQEIDLLKMLVDHHVMPEIAIYRAEAVRQLVSAPQFCYWAFAYLATMISQGPIAFRDVPYYRSVTLTPVMPNRHQEGTHDNLHNWDAFRGGIEFMIFSLLKRAGLTPDREPRIDLPRHGRPLPAPAHARLAAALARAQGLSEGVRADRPPQLSQSRQREEHRRSRHAAAPPQGADPRAARQRHRRGRASGRLRHRGYRELRDGAARPRPEAAHRGSCRRGPDGRRIPGDDLRLHPRRGDAAGSYRRRPCARPRRQRPRHRGELSALTEHGRSFPPAIVTQPGCVEPSRSAPNPPGNAIR